VPNSAAVGDSAMNARIFCGKTKRLSATADPTYLLTRLAQRLG